MRVRWIGDARAVPDLGISCGPGEVYDLPEAAAASLIEQGRCVLEPVRESAPRGRLPAKPESIPMTTEGGEE